MLTRRDPWVNLLRVTAATFAAGVGGRGRADDRTSSTPCSAQPGELGRRMARNTQLLLQEESNIGRVLDPAGGSGYVESLTDELATVGVGRCSGSSRPGGGLPGAAGRRHCRRAHRRGPIARLRQVATRQRPITGVSEFPDLFEEPVGRRAATGPLRRPAPSGAGLGPVGRGRSRRCATPPTPTAPPTAASQGVPGQPRPGRRRTPPGPPTPRTSSRSAASRRSRRSAGRVGFADAGRGGRRRSRQRGAPSACICSSDAVYAERAERVRQGADRGRRRPGLPGRQPGRATRGRDRGRRGRVHRRRRRRARRPATGPRCARPRPDRDGDVR